MGRPRILITLNAAINDVIKSEEVQAKLTAAGFDPILASQAQAEIMFNDEVKKWGNMVDALHLSIN